MRNKTDKTNKKATERTFDNMDEPPMGAEESGTIEESPTEYDDIRQPREFQNAVDDTGFNLQTGMQYENFIKRIYPETLDDILQLTDMNPLLESYSSMSLILADHLERRALPRSASVLRNTVMNISKVRVSHRRMGRSEIVQMMSGQLLPPAAFTSPTEEKKKSWWGRFFD